jgi:hypothetical protein
VVVAVTDPLADVLHQAEHEWRISGGAQGEWQDVLARVAREHIEGPVRALHRKSTGRIALCVCDGYLYPCPTIKALEETS